jgi:hypothetical protein
MGKQKSAEAIVGVSLQTEGLNTGYESELVYSMMQRTTARANPSPDPQQTASSCDAGIGSCSAPRHKQEQLRAGLTWS